MVHDKKPVAMRISAALKAAGEQRARQDHRSFSAHLEWLIEQDAKAHGMLGGESVKRRKQKESGVDGTENN